jgi:hypothetical protein
MPGYVSKIGYADMASMWLIFFQNEVSLLVLLPFVLTRYSTHTY